MARSLSIRGSLSNIIGQQEHVKKIVLPDGFRIKNLAEDNNLRKIHRVLWRGFNHDGEPPEEGIEWRRKMQSGPNFRKDLTIVGEAPGVDFVSFKCGSRSQNIKPLEIK